MKMKDTNQQYNSEYYLMAGIYRTSKFEDYKTNLFANFTARGVPAPSQGFEDIPEFMEWKKELGATGFRLTQAYSRFFEVFNIKETRERRSSLEKQLFFGATVLPSPKVGIRVTPLSDGSTEVSFVFRGLPTDKELLEKLKTYREMVKGDKRFSAKNKPWENFDRDFELYQLAERLSIEEPKNLYKAVTGSSEFKSLAEVHGDVNSDTFYKILGKCKEIFGSANLTKK